MFSRGGLLWLASLLPLAAGSVPTPREHFGFNPGDDFKLANHREIVAYFEKLAAASDRIRLVEFGRTPGGRPMHVAYISSPANLSHLDRWKEISRRLALGQPESGQARSLASEGKAIVWIDSGLHASEVAPVQHAPVLAYRMVTGEDAETRRIRDQVILMQIPVINPDGLDMVAGWYRKNAGSPYELAPLPWLYQKYAGHDNNRDWFMMNLEETRNVTRLLYREWFPQILYNQHQAPPFPARIFVPPYAEPLNPNIPSPVMEGINLIGAAIKERFALESKPGILSYWGFDAWWNGGLRSTPAFHNIHGILTETAIGAGYGTPREWKPNELPERFGNGMPAKEPGVFYQRPWMGGRWGVREAIDYMLTADFAILDLAANRPASFLLKSWEVARANIAEGRKGSPFAYVIPADQWDASAAQALMSRLDQGAVEIYRARTAFRAADRHYAAGTYVIPAAQPFRAYIIDLLEPQKYPEIRTSSSGPAKRPYDITGWTLNLQMGVKVDRIAESFSADLERISELNPAAEVSDYRQNAAYATLSRRLAEKRPVRWSASGEMLAPDNPSFSQGKYELHSPRVGVYEPWTANIDAGWTEWVLDEYKVPFTAIHNQDIQAGNLRSRFDAIVLSSQPAAAILHGTRFGEAPSRPPQGLTPGLQRPEYSGGIALEGLMALSQFVRSGGTLIALDRACELVTQFLPAGVRPLLRGGADDEDPGPNSYYSPGTLIHIDVDPRHPVGFGMPAEAVAFSSGGQAFEIALRREYNQGDREIRSVARYAQKDLLASGWISGEKTVLGKHILIEARHGAGRVILFGFRPQFRGQTFGTFKLLLNAIYLAAATEL